MKQIIRQGDVLLKMVEKEPPIGAKVTQKVILAEGELTGHTHVLTANKILEWEENGQRYIQVSSDDNGVLFHEDHDPTPVAVVTPKVTYHIIPQQEWSLADQWRKVQD